MAEVSCRALGVFVSCERAGLFSIDRLLAGSGLDRGTLEHPRRRVSWTAWARLCERCGVLLGSDEALERAGRLAFTDGQLGRTGRALGRMLDGRKVYAGAARWVGPSLYRNLQFRLRDVGYRQVEVRVEIPPPYLQCRAWMLLLKGAIAFVPRMVGQPDAVLLESRVDPRVGIFRLILPATRRAGAARWRHSRRAIGALPAEAALQLHKSEETNRILLETLPDLVLRVRRDGILLDVKAGRAHPQFDMLVRFVGQDVRVLSKAYPNAASDAVAQALAAAEEAIERKAERLVDLRAVFADGRRDFECRIIPLDNEEVIAIVRDLTDRRRIERQLAIAERMASVGSLAAGVAHEVNNPLTYVMGSLERALRLLEMQPQDSEKLRGVLDQALEGAGRVRDIIRSLTHSTSDREPSLDSVDVQHVLDRALEMTSSELSGVAEVQREYQQCPPVFASSGRLLQVFVNLLVNAQQALEELHSEGRGTIRLTTGRDAKGNVVVEVRDSGPGIPKHALGHIFDPFFTTKEHRSGTGLGLWHCQRIIADFGGEIIAENLPGGGASFRVVVPPIPASQRVQVDTQERRVADGVIDAPSA